MAQVAPYGSWKSPITADLIASKMVELGDIVLDGDDIYWLEMRPSEGGRYVIVRRTPDGTITDVNPPPFNARTRVHEYGGGSYLVHKGMVYFSNFADQRLYRVEPGSQPTPVTPEGPWRYADGTFDPWYNRIICVREDHSESDREAVNTLASVPLDGSGRVEVLVSGSDFYSTPRLSHAGSRLCWLAWNHPNMPWDGSELWLAEINEDGSLGHTELVAGDIDKSVFQPEWSPDGSLFYVYDGTGWWNLYRWRSHEAEACTHMEAEFGLPQWVFGMSSYAFESEKRMLCAYTQGGVWHLASLDPDACRLQPIETPYTVIGDVRAVPGRALFIGASPTEFAEIVQFDPVAREMKVLRRMSDITVDPGYISVPEAIDFPSANGQTVHAFYYPPKNRDYEAPPGDKPPLLVYSHGGPTGATNNALRLGVQYWTSRGIAVVDVNYGGSTGYGRRYRNRLDGKWGIVDVDDCVNAARYLAKRGDVDGNRLAIRGGSAGGYTTLAALAFRDVFKAGASYFGISDLETMTQDTHKFESRYLNRLVGLYPLERQTYRERSPMYHVDQLSCPVIFFQGLEDKVVPPDQAEKMVDVLRKKGIPVAYVAFEGEQHGFRKAENIKRSTEAELYFYSRVFGFDLADPVEPVPIENLD